MRRIASFLGCFALAGCVVGPNYVEPPQTVPRAYGEAVAPPVAGEADRGRWWQALGDTTLDGLVRDALKDSPDIGIAVARIARARAEARVARAAALPEADAQGGFNYERFSKNAGLSSLSSLFGGGAGGGSGTSGGNGSGSSGGGIAAPGDSIHTYSVGFDASWELDLFGGVTRRIEGAQARAQAAEWNARDAQLSLIAEIADAYFQLRTFQAREAIARAEVARQQGQIEIMAHTAQAGLVPQGDFIRQRAALADAEAQVGPIVAAGKAEMHALAVLTGRTPDALIDTLSNPAPPLPTLPDVPPGLPSELLRRRPDIRAAERNLAAATADVGVAVADLYPHLSLTGMGEFISTALGNLLSSDSLQLTGAATATFPVLDFGRRSGQVAANRAAADEAYFDYKKTVLTALRDVEDALIRLHTEQERRASLAAGLTDAMRAAQTVEARYQTGLVNFGDVLQARQSVLSDRSQLADSDGMLRRDTLSLLKALGGGWEALPLDVPRAGAAAAVYTRRKR